MNEVSSRCIGLDVHKETIAVAIADPEQAPVLYGTIANDPRAIRKLVRQLGDGRRCGWPTKPVRLGTASSAS